MKLSAPGGQKSKSSESRIPGLAVWEYIFFVPPPPPLSLSLSLSHTHTHWGGEGGAVLFPSVQNYPRGRGGGGLKRGGDRQPIIGRDVLPRDTSKIIATWQRSELFFRLSD